MSGNIKTIKYLENVGAKYSDGRKLVRHLLRQLITVRDMNIVKYILWNVDITDTEIDYVIDKIMYASNLNILKYFEERCHYINYDKCFDYILNSRHQKKLVEHILSKISTTTNYKILNYAIYEDDIELFEKLTNTITGPINYEKLLIKSIVVGSLKFVKYLILLGHNVSFDLGVFYRPPCSKKFQEVYIEIINAFCSGALWNTALQISIERKLRYVVKWMLADHRMKTVNDIGRHGSGKVRKMLIKSGFWDHNYDPYRYIYLLNEKHLDVITDPVIRKIIAGRNRRYDFPRDILIICTN